MGTPKTGSKTVKVCAAILIVFFSVFGVFVLTQREFEAGVGSFACTLLPTYYLVTRRRRRSTIAQKEQAS